MKTSSFIILNRKILKWEWYNNQKVFKMFIHCLIKANWKDKNHEGILIKRSTFMTSLGKLSEETGLSIKEVRNSLSKLESTGEIQLNKPKEGKKGKSFTLVTVCKYDDYQEKKKNKGTGGAQEGHTEGTEGAQKGQLLTSNNNNNNNNKDIIYRDAEENFELLFENEKYIGAITKKFDITVEELKTLYEEFNEHLALRNDGFRSESEYTAYFFNWYTKKYNKDKRTGESKRSPIFKQTF